MMQACGVALRFRPFAMKRPATMKRWNNWTRFLAGAVWRIDEPQTRVVRFVSASPQIGERMRVTFAGGEVEARIEAVERSTLRVRVGRRLF